MPDLEGAVERSITQRRLLRPRETVLVAVSGGADSCVLLHLLHRLAKQNRWELHVIHFNHRLRGPESDGDEAMVGELARRLDLPFHTGIGDVRKCQREKGLSPEMAARELRHAFFARTAQSLGAAVVALGHHADDQLELFWIRLLRGSGGSGLSGMNWESPSPADPAVRLIRPLLGCTREAIEAFAANHQIAFRQDRTNVSGDILRNRIRHHLIPLLKSEYQPRLAQVIGRTIDIVQAETAVVEQHLRDWIASSPRRPFNSLPAALQRRWIQCQAWQAGIALDFRQTESLRLRPGCPLPWHGQWILRRDESGTLHRDLASPTANPWLPEELDLDLVGGKGTLQLHGLSVQWHRQFPSGHWRRPPRQPGREIFDADKLGGRIRLRHWRPGDRFQPIGMKRPVKLQDIFTNQKIPRRSRYELVVGTTASGQLFWVEGLRIGEHFKLDKGTKVLLKWEWYREESGTGG